MKKLILSFIIIIILFFNLPPLFAKIGNTPKSPQVYGKIDMMAAKRSTSGIENFGIKSEVEIRNGNLGAEFTFDYAKSQTEDELDELRLKSGIQGNYFFDKNYFGLIGFEYETDESLSWDHKNDFFIGVGYQGNKSSKWLFAIQSAIALSSVYTDMILERDVLNQTSGVFMLPISGPFSLEGEGDLEWNLDNIHDYDRIFDDYRLNMQVAVAAEFSPGLKAKLYHRWDYDTQERPKDRRVTGVAMGVYF